MATTEQAEVAMTANAANTFETEALEDTGLMTAVPREVAYKEAWRQAAENIVVMRFANFSDFEEEGLIPPRLRAIEKALRLSQLLRDRAYPPPTRIIPNGEGGIVFERWKAADNVERLEVFADGHVEVSEFQGQRRIHLGRIT